MKPVMPVGSEFSVAEEAAAETPDGEGGEAPAAPQKHFTEINVGGEKKRVEVDEVEIATKAFEYQAQQLKAGKTVSYEDALIAVYPKKKSAAKA